jgi:hypothetical protein
MKKEENLVEGTVLSKNPGCNLMNLILEDGLDFSVYELNSGEDVTNHLVHFNKMSRPDLLKIKKKVLFNIGWAYKQFIPLIPVKGLEDPAFLQQGISLYPCIHLT